MSLLNIYRVPSISSSPSNLGTKNFILCIKPLKESMLVEWCSIEREEKDFVIFSPQFLVFNTSTLDLTWLWFFHFSFILCSTSQFYFGECCVQLKDFIGEIFGQHLQNFGVNFLYVIIPLCSRENFRGGISPMGYFSMLFFQIKNRQFSFLEAPFGPILMG